MRFWTEGILPHHVPAAHLELERGGTLASLKILITYEGIGLNNYYDAHYGLRR